MKTLKLNLLIFGIVIGPLFAAVAQTAAPPAGEQVAKTADLQPVKQPVSTNATGAESRR